MSVVAPVFDKADPKSEKLYPYHLPYTSEWAEKKDRFGQATMMMAGGGMFMRNPLIIWTGMILAVQSYVTQEPLRAPKDDKNASSPLATIGMAISGVFAMTVPKLMLAAEAPSAATASIAATVSAATTSA